MGARGGGPRPRARWVTSGPAPPAALLGADRCDHEAYGPDLRTARGELLPQLVFCARPRGHAGEHAVQPRRRLGGWWRQDPPGWWCWPDDGTHPLGEQRARHAVARHGRQPPPVAGPGEQRCAARGDIWHVNATGGMGLSVWSEPVRCALPRGHELPHCSTPTRARPPGNAATAPRGMWHWWIWPAPPAPEPTPEQRWRVHLQRVAAAAVGLALLALFVLGLLQH